MMQARESGLTFREVLTPQYKPFDWTVDVNTVPTFSPNIERGRKWNLRIAIVRVIVRGIKKKMITMR